MDETGVGLGTVLATDIVVGVGLVLLMGVARPSRGRLCG
jgi:hypothetical protein